MYVVEDLRLVVISSVQVLVVAQATIEIVNKLLKGENNE